VKRRLSSTWICVGVLGLSALSFGCRSPVSAAPQSAIRTLRLVTSNRGASSYRLGSALVPAFRSSGSNLRLALQESTGSIENVESIESGNADVGFMFADVAYVAFSGHLGNRAFHRLRGIAVLQSSPFHFITGKGSTIRTVKDLRGRRLSVGVASSGSSMTVSLVLSAFDVDPKTVQFDSTPARDAAHHLEPGGLDAMLVMATDPYDPVTVATKAGGRLLPIEGPAVDRLRQDAPFVHVRAIPEYTYPGQTTRVHSIAIDNVLICRSDLDEDVVYQLTKQFFETLLSFASAETSLRMIDFSRVDGTPIPLHEGAARYYRERELFR
jgi:TRAP transporter TAXI family solute receptor